MHSVKARSGHFIKVLILFLAGILAHTLSGGSLVESNRLLTFSALIGLCIFLTRNQILEGPHLAMLVLALQSMGHFALGGANKSGDLRMTLAHLFAGIVSYKTVGHLDRFWEFLARIIEFLHIPIFEELAIKCELPSKSKNYVAPIISREFFSTSQYRGPPTKELQWI